MIKISGYNIVKEFTPEIAANKLVKQLEKNVKKCKDENGSCILAISGGSSILKIYDALKELNAIQSTFWENVYILWVDERHVPHTSKDSNYGSAYRYYWKDVKYAELIPVLYDPNLKSSVDYYRSRIAELPLMERGIDITLLGMGNDAHTASLFPHSKALKQNKELIVSAKLKNLHQDRITMSFRLLNKSNEIFLYAYGVEKGNALKQALQSGDLNKYPILGIEKSKVVIFTDDLFFKELES